MPAKKYKFKDLNIITKNVRGLKSITKKQELFSQLITRNLFAICLQETWTSEFTILEYKQFMLLTHGRPVSEVTSKRGQEGVGIALSRNAVIAWKAAGSEIHTDLGSRLIAIRLSVKDARGKDIGIFLISAYSPIGAANEDVWSDYLNKLDIIMSRKRNSDVLIIGCDCNSSLGTTNRESEAMFKNSIGKFGLTHRNLSGVRFMTFLETRNLLALSSYYRKKLYATWTNPRSKLPHQIDHVLIHKDSFKRFTDCGVITPLVDSDHNAVMCRIRLIACFKMQLSVRQNMIKLDKNSLLNQQTAKHFAQAVVQNYDIAVDGSNYSKLATAIGKTALETLPKSPRPQPDWFEADKANLLNLINKRNHLLKVHISRSTRSSARKLRSARKELTKAITRAKENWILLQLNSLNSTGASVKGTKLCWDSRRPQSAWQLLWHYATGSRLQSPCHTYP